jgi:hypothetical protein
MMTERDKLECAEYTIELLGKALKRDGPFSTAHGEWILRAKNECIMRLGQYMTSILRIGL